jgi:DNA-binding NarL/FixJ family response regulator
MTANTKPMRTLVVDDHAGFRQALLRSLRRLDWLSIIGEGENGVEAVQRSEELRPDVVLLDLAMPEMGGLQACRLIKAQDQAPFVAIVSHFDDNQHREFAARAGADAFISKLQVMQELVPVLEALYASRTAQGSNNHE